MKRIFLPAVGLALALPIAAMAHVVVGPPQAGVGRFQVFTVSVPVEKDQAATGVRVLVPSGLEAVLPTVKPGWNIEVKSGHAEGASNGHEDASAVSEISWSGGSIPPGRRDEFSFSARVPAREGVLAWKAYQSYADGSVVSWDRDPKERAPLNAQGRPDFSRFGPWSQTRVFDDLKQTGPDPREDVALWIGAIALFFAFLAFGMAWSAARRR
jgi:uncharacterized protein YcnI